jgi:hypothetical protein
MEGVRDAVETGRQLLSGIIELLPQPEPEPEPVGPERVLTVGDGDLSYSLDLRRAAQQRASIASVDSSGKAGAGAPPPPPLELVATTWDSHETLLRCYGEAIAASIAELSQHVDEDGEGDDTAPAVRSRCLHDVDGTALAETLGDAAGERFDRIDWLFPHTGQKKIQTNRALLRAFFVSARSQLRPGGTVRVALCAGQGGTPAEEPHRKYGDSWHVVEQAACAGLVLTSVTPFEKQLQMLPGYRSTGHRKTSRGFRTAGSLLHVFAEPATRGDNSVPNSLYPPSYEHCVTFWWSVDCLAPGADLEAGTGRPLSEWLLRVLQDVAGAHRVESCDLAERWDPPEAAVATPAAPVCELEPEPEPEPEPAASSPKFKPGHTSLSYRIVYRSRTTALSREEAANLQANVRIQLGLMGVPIR